MLTSELGDDFLRERFELRTQARTLSAALEAGRLHALSDRLSLGPVVALDYRRTTIDAHSENGPVRRAVTYDRSRHASLELQVGGQLRQVVTLAARPVTLSADARHVRELADGRATAIDIIDASGWITPVAPDRSDRAFGRVSVGADMAITPTADSWIALQGRVAHPDGSRATVHAGIALRF